MIVHAYDLDGVLAASPPGNFLPWRRMTGVQRKERELNLASHYEMASPLFIPPAEQQFWVITARKVTHTSRTWAWLNRHLSGRVLGLFLLREARTLPNVIRFKAEVLRDCSVTDYYEDNRQVVLGLRKTVPSCRVWQYKDGKMILDYKAPV